MTLWLAYNGWMGGTSVGCIVDADGEEQAREIAAAALAAEVETQPGRDEGEKRSYATVETIEPLELPWVGEIG